MEDKLECSLSLFHKCKSAKALQNPTAIKRKLITDCLCLISMKCTQNLAFPGCKEL